VCWCLQVRLVKMQQDLEVVVHHLQAPKQEQEEESLALAQAREKRLDTFLDVQDDLERALLHLDPRCATVLEAYLCWCLAEDCSVSAQPPLQHIARATWLPVVLQRLFLSCVDQEPMC
jgi:hypothetical protein